MDLEQRLERVEQEVEDMSLYERVVLEFCIVIAGVCLAYEFVRMWRERRRTRRELWQIFYERRQGRRDGGE